MFFPSSERKNYLDTSFSVQKESNVKCERGFWGELSLWQATGTEGGILPHEESKVR